MLILNFIIILLMLFYIYKENPVVTNILGKKNDVMFRKFYSIDDLKSWPHLLSSYVEKGLKCTNYQVCSKKK